MTASTLISPSPNRTLGNAKLVGATILGLIAWFAVYWQLEPFSNWAVAQLPITPGSHLAEAASFFIFDTPKVLMLLALAVSIIAGWVIGRLHLESWLEQWVLDVRSGSADLPSEHLIIADCIHAGIEAVRDIFGRVWVWIIVGIAAGAFIPGYVPAEMLAGIMGSNLWWSVPAAVLVGIPIYSNAAGIIPVVEALFGKGAALGTVLAFMMAVTALSAPEMIILRKVLTARLIAVFIGVVTIGIVSTSGIVIDGKVVHAGGLPKAEDLAKWLTVA